MEISMGDLLAFASSTVHAQVGRRGTLTRECKASAAYAHNRARIS